jgi:hypothetical protein
LAEKGPIAGIGWLVMAGAAASAAPALWMIVRNLWRNAPSDPLPVWACLLLLYALIELGYGIWLEILPRRDVVRTTSIAFLALAAVAAMLMGWLLFAGPENAVRVWLQLAFDSPGPIPVRSGTAVAWCFVLVNIAGLLSYLTGRLALRAS